MPPSEIGSKATQSPGSALLTTLPPSADATSVIVTPEDAV
jgi:hypothetical protein